MFKCNRSNDDILYVSAIATAFSLQLLASTLNKKLLNALASGYK